MAVSVTKIEERLAERKRLVEQAGELVTRARQEERELSADESAQFDLLHESADGIRKEIDAERRRAEIAAERLSRQREAEDSLKASRGRQVRPEQVPGAEAQELTFRGRKLKIAPNSAAARRSSPEYREAFSGYIATGVNAGLQTDLAENGGYMTPAQTVAEIVKTLDNTFWFRKLSNVLPPTSAPSVKMPRRSARMQKFIWGQELQTPTADTQLKMGGYSLTPHYMVGEIQVSVDLLMSAIVDADAFVIDEIVFCSGDTEEDAFFNGDGKLKPTGLFVANPQGIDTDRDTTAVIGQDGLVDCKMALREPYLRSPNLRWVCGRAFMKACMKLKSTTNEPLWLVSLREGAPDMLLGVPVVLSEYAPTSVASGAYPAVIGDFRNYDIIDSIDMGIARDESLGRRSNLIVYIVRRKVDGCPRISEAFSRFKVT